MLRALDKTTAAQGRRLSDYFLIPKLAKRLLNFAI